MAIERKDKKAGISAAPVAIATPVLPSNAHSRVTPKGSVHNRKAAPETSPVTTPEPVASDREHDVFFQRFIRLALMDANTEDVTATPIETWIKDNLLSLGKDFDPKDPIDNAYAHFQRSNSTDRRITADFESRGEYTPHIYNPLTGGRVAPSPNVIIDDGFRAPAFKLSKSEAREALAADIKTVSGIYAAEAGMSPKDFAKVMGGIATIESSFGVIRSVTGTKYSSSAGGAFHYLNDTISGQVIQHMKDPHIATRLEQLGVQVGNGLSKSEAWTMKEDNVLAGSILAKRIIETVRKSPELKDDIVALATRVYQSHNLGDAGARALAQGGRAALEAKDHRADDNNPMFFRGASSDAEVNQRYTKFVTNAIASASKLIDNAFDGPSTTLTQAKPNTKPTIVASAHLPERASPVVVAENKKHRLPAPEPS